jgi:hypothetical protein
MVIAVFLGSKSKISFKTEANGHVEPLSFIPFLQISKPIVAYTFYPE